MELHAIVTAVGIGLVSELGDRSQLLLFALAMRYRHRGPLIAGMLVATILTHSLAGLVGVTVGEVLDPDLLRWVAGATFFGLALWSLYWRLDVHLHIVRLGGVVRLRGVFISVAVTFFLIEICDKSNLTTAALSTQPDSALEAVIGTILGVAIINVPIALFGGLLAEALVTRGVSVSRLAPAVALFFVVLGILTVFGVEIL
jgi:Ca2+/H+ antiporter, TMEM165/GDT1 family